MITSREKLLAALAHSTILLLGAGTAVPLLVWNSQRDRSRFVSEQAQQALWWQSLVPIYLQLVLLVECIIFLVLSAASGFSAELNNTLPQALPDGLLPWLLTGMGVAVGLYILLGLVAAVLCLFGKGFVYPVFGRQLLRFMQADAAAEERLVAGAAHAGMFVPMLGMLVPLLAWAMVKPASARLRFHNLQALIFQGASLLTNMLLTGVLLILSLPLVVLAANLFEARDVSPLLIGLTLVLVALVFLFSMLAALALPVFGLFACIAIVKVLGGKEYTYPFMKWLHKKFAAG